MFIWALLIAILVAHWLSKDLNSWLPSWKRRQNFWLLELIYMGLNVVAPFFLLISLVTLQFHWKAICIGVWLYLVAFLFKKAIWCLAYKL